MAKEGGADAEMATSRDVPASFTGLRSRRPNSIKSVPFAGRIGGNQEFVETGDSAESEEILKKQPDAAPILDWRDALNLNGFYDIDIYRLAVIEAYATCLLTFILGAISSGLTSLPPSTSPMAVVLYAALINWIGLALFVYAAAPASGGHLNPSITMATFFAGLATLPRAVIYIVAQIVGAIVGGYWLRLGMGEAFFAAGVIPGCTVDRTLVSAGQLWVLEFMFGLSLIFVAFGVGLEPRQAKVFGPALAPILVGASLALATLAGGLARPGYTGASFNPARCLGLMTAKDIFQYHWVHWTGPLAAAIVNGAFYHFQPPYKRNGKP